MVGESLKNLAPANLQTGEGRATFAVNRRNNREADVADVPRVSRAVRPHRGTADDFHVGDLRKVGENFVLDALGEIRVGLVVAQTVEGQDGDGFIGDRNGRVPRTVGSSGARSVSLGWRCRPIARSSRSR